MTTVSFLVEQSRIVGFDVQGHSGWGDEGADIVCAAVTSAIRLVESTVNDVMGLCASVKVRERTPRSSFVCPAACPPRRRVPAKIC
ncbi:MAG: ribosomal-processing cysteine protease Prp [Oscillospiraceae bacterium]